MSGLRVLTGILLLAWLTGCGEKTSGAVGQLMSDRVEISVEVAEAIVALAVQEGDPVTPGQLLITQNDERVVARLAEAEAVVGRIEALLAEQLQGPRSETIEAARARVSQLRIELDFQTGELQRLTGLRQRNLTSAESVALAQRLRDTAQAALEGAQAQLTELENGTRPEQLEQTRFSLQQAQAQQRQLEIERQRHRLLAPVAGVVDSLLFEVGERPMAGTVVAVLLAGNQPHARVYVPETYRVGVHPGDPVRVRVDGLAGLLDGTVRWIAGEASFTPYFALTENDRSRLSYVAEISLPELPDRLPEGVPLEAYFAGMQVPADE